jgi:tRNA dimethylallyltransferase
LSKLFADGRSDPLPNRIIKLVISPGERRIIHQRIKQRFYAMVELGLLNEVRLLYERGDLAPTMPSMRMVGYRQVWKYLEGKLDYQRMLEHAVIATRQLAKRQMTWLRAEHDAMWFEAAADDMLDNTVKFITRDPVFNLLA